MTMWTPSCSKESSVTKEQDIQLSLAGDEETVTSNKCITFFLIKWRLHPGQIDVPFKCKYVFALKTKCFKTHMKLFVVFALS